MAIYIHYIIVTLANYPLNLHPQQIQELEATLYNALQQDKVIGYGEPLSDMQKDELRTSVEKLRRQMLRKSREFDCQVLAERMELLHQAHQVQYTVTQYIPFS